MKQINTLLTASALAVSILTLFSCADTGSPSTLTAKPAVLIDTPIGKIEGLVEGSLNVFKGIPYAQAPLGAARWKPPVPVTPWTGVKMAKQFGDACIQPTRKFPSIYANDISPSSEDCLSLNIWAPANAKDAPVFVWIHGGSLTAGSSKEPSYDGSKLANQDMIVVSINYRVGALGYLALAQLSAESPDNISGNYGLLDQIESLRWINNNIAAFGGDSSNITIAGESAGALSVMHLMAAPSAHGLFSKAIAQSAYMISLPELKQNQFGQNAAEMVGAYTANQVGAKDLAYLRAMDAQELADGAAAAGFFPIPNVDGKVLTGQMVDIFDKGEQAHVPLLVGFNSGEIRSLKMLAPPVPITSAKYEHTIRANYLDLADEFLQLYPSTDMQENIYATTRDALYGWTSERMAKNQTEIGQPSYLYLFDHGYPAADNADLHAFHASEIPYVFGTFDRTPKLWPKNPDTAEEHAFSDAMIQYWSSFAKTAKPQADNHRDWPEYGTEQAYMLFGDSPTPATNLFPGMYELHEKTVCRRKESGKSPWHWNAGLISPILTKPINACL